MLDLGLGNEPGQVIKVSVGEHFGNSDHNSLSFKLLVDKDTWSSGEGVKLGGNQLQH